MSVAAIERGDLWYNGDEDAAVVGRAAMAWSGNNACGCMRDGVVDVGNDTSVCECSVWAWGIC